MEDKADASSDIIFVEVFAQRGFLRILYAWDEGAVARPNSDMMIKD